jgi:hypothetical protein
LKRITGVVFSQKLLDRVGGCLSTACAIHCAIKPLLFVLPSIAWLDLLMGHTAERIMLSTGVLLASTSVSWGFSRHGCYRVFWMLTAALLLIGTGRYALDGVARTLLVVPGGLTIAGTHVVNTVLINRCERCPSDRETLG